MRRHSYKPGRRQTAQQIARQCLQLLGSCSYLRNSLFTDIDPKWASRMLSKVNDLEMSVQNLHSTVMIQADPEPLLPGKLIDIELLKNEIDRLTTVERTLRLQLPNLLRSNHWDCTRPSNAEGMPSQNKTHNQKRSSI